MPLQAFYHLPSFNAHVLTNALLAAYPAARPSSQQTFSHTSQLFRSVLDPAQSTDRSSAATDAFVQVLNLSASPEVTYCISSSPSPQPGGVDQSDRQKDSGPTTVELPWDSSFLQLLSTKLNGLWTPSRLHDLHVEGQIWAVAGYSIAIGDVRAKGGADRGVAVAVRPLQDVSPEPEDATVKQKTEAFAKRWMDFEETKEKELVWSRRDGDGWGLLLRGRSVAGGGRKRADK